MPLGAEPGLPSDTVSRLGGGSGGWHRGSWSGMRRDGDRHVHCSADSAFQPLNLLSHDASCILTMHQVKRVRFSSSPSTRTKPPPLCDQHCTALQSWHLTLTTLPRTLPCSSPTIPTSSLRDLGMASRHHALSGQLSMCHRLVNNGPFRRCGHPRRSRSPRRRASVQTRRHPAADV